MNNKALQYNPKAKHQITTYFKFPCIFESEHILTVIIHSWLSVFPSIPTCWCILISHLSTAPVSAAPVLSAKGQAGPPSRVHTFSREINGLSLQFLPLSFFVICRHWVGACLQKANTHLATYVDWKQMDAPLVLMNLEIWGPFTWTVTEAGRADGAFPHSVFVWVNKYEDHICFVCVFLCLCVCARAPAWVAQWFLLI